MKSTLRMVLCLGVLLLPILAFADESASQSPVQGVGWQQIPASGMDLWLDPVGGLLWDTRMEVGHWSVASKDCSMRTELAGLVSGHPELAIKWRLPTSLEFIKAEENGIRHVITNMNFRTFWSSTRALTRVSFQAGQKYHQQYYRVFDSLDGVVSDGSDIFRSYMCVGEFETDKQTE
ncbi:MAG: hypothetical protein HY843_08525 [Bdellovibrio sp.]|nr:hypothetical protein [Bdellovibrio sp.]